MRKNTKFLCFLTTFATLTLIIGAAGLDEEANVVEYDEHLFIAGNDSTGTAAITFVSRFNPHPIVKRFDNFSFPESCALHPSRCRNLTYLSSTTSDNDTRLIFYVPLTKSALGVMEFVYNGTALSHMQTRTVTVPRRCSPISTLNLVGSLHLFCISDDGQQDLIMCQVRSAMVVKDVWLDCSTSQNSFDRLSHLSNFVVYGNQRIDKPIYFTYGNAMYAKNPLSGVVDVVSSLPQGYMYCRHIDFLNSSEPSIVGYCYHSNSLTNTNQIQVVYFNLSEHTSHEQRNASLVVSYHCPLPQTFIEVAVIGAYASFWQGGSNKGSFNIIGNSVSFGSCFEFGNSIHFLYHDERLGTFIKPHISINLREAVEQLSVQECVNPVCEQPLIFNSRYILLQHKNSNLRNWTLRLIDIQQGWNHSILTFNSSSTSQLALISNFVHVLTDLPPTTTATPIATAITNTLVIGTSTTIPFVVVVLVVVVPLLIFIKIRFKQRSRESLRHQRGSYSPVKAISRSESSSRQVSPTARDMEMTELADDKTESNTPTSSPRMDCLINQNGDSVSRSSPTSCDNGTHSEWPQPSLQTTSLGRENYGVIGSSKEDVQRSGKLVSAQPPPAPGQTPTAIIENGTVSSQQQQPAHSAQMLPPIATASSNLVSSAVNTSNVLPLHSQHSNDSTVNSTQGLENSFSSLAFSEQQANRPQSLMYNLAPNQQSMPASPGSGPTLTNFTGTAQHPLRMISTESNTSHSSRISDRHVSSATTPAELPFHTNSTPSSPFVDLSAAATTSQNSPHYDYGDPGLLNMDRSMYSAVGCSQENVQRPLQCTQSPRRVSGNTSTVGCTGTTNTTSLTPQQQLYSSSQPLGASSPGMANHNHGMVPYLHSQRSNDSTGSGTSFVPDNSISVPLPSHTSRHQSLNSAPFMHNQATGYSSPRQPPIFNRMDSNTSQNSIHTPTDHPAPIFFSSSTNQGSICPPRSVTLSEVQYATSTDS